MTIFVAVFAVLYVSVRMRRWVRDRYVPWYELRLQERLRGLPRGSLAERWQHAEDWITDDAWCRLLKHLNRATRLERKQLLRQR